MKIWGLLSGGLWIPSLALKFGEFQKYGSICTNGPEIGGILAPMVLKMQLLVIIYWWGLWGRGHQHRMVLCRRKLASLVL